MKNNAPLVFIVMIVFTALSWYGVFSNHANDTKAYERLIADGDGFSDKGIYIDAVNSYESALALNAKDFATAMKIADMYKNLNDANGLLKACDNAMTIEPNRSEPYVFKAEYFISRAMYSEAIKVLADAKGISDREKIDSLSLSLDSKFTEKYVSFQSIGDWRIQNRINYIAACENDKWGMTEKDGTKKIRFIYDYIGAYSEREEVVPCSFEGQYYYIDIRGNKKLVGDREYQFLGSFGDGLAPAQFDGKYGYINSRFDEQKFEYEFAGSFAYGTAAVKKDGKWALIDTEFNNVTNFEFDNILLDANGFCSLYGVAVVQKGGQYFLFDVEAKKFSDTAFAGAKLAASPDGAMAVKIGDLWGFVDKEGKIVVEAQYDDAHSFSLGLAPAKYDDRWGYINNDNEFVIEAKYFDAKSFSIDGSAAVKTAANWNLIVLCKFE